jgi:hypothetical protein
MEESLVAARDFDRFPVDMRRSAHTAMVSFWKQPDAQSERCDDGPVLEDRLDCLVRRTRALRGFPGCDFPAQEETAPPPPEIPLCRAEITAGWHGVKLRTRNHNLNEKIASDQDCENARLYPWHGILPLIKQPLY